MSYLSANLTLALGSLFGSLIRDNRSIWIAEYDWCIYVVQGTKGYNESSKTDSCISFYISESILDDNSDLTPPNLKGTLRFIRTMLHEGFHVHSLKTNVNKGVDLFLFEVKAYLISEYINIYSSYIFDVEIEDYESDISVDDRQYLLENCKSKKNLERLLLVNQGRESFLAYITVNLLLLDISSNLGLAPIYIDFILEHLSRSETKTLEPFSFIISCNPENSNIVDALKSATLDYDFESETLNFPTTDYFLNDAYDSDGKRARIIFR